MSEERGAAAAGGGAAEGATGEERASSGALEGIEALGGLGGLAQLGAQLRGAGLTARALAAWAGTARIAALPARLDAMPVDAPTPAAALLALLIGGAELARASLDGRGTPTGSAADGRGTPTGSAADGRRGSIDGLIDALIARGVVEDVAGRLRARVAIVPLGAGLLVCDRLDAPIERDLVCWPDDSSHHLATAIPPGRRDRWLDLGCGSAFAAIARPELARRITGVDLNPRAVRHARAGAALSGLRHVEVVAGDVSDAGEPADLVTCNAPMPAAAGDPRGAALPELWRRADPGFFERLWPALARAVRPGGMVVVHGAAGAVLPALADAAGERVCVIYTPEAMTGRGGGFAVAWWRPDAPARRVTVHRALTAARPHVDPQDREDALAHGGGAG